VFTLIGGGILWRWQTSGFYRIRGVSWGANKILPC